MVFKNEFSLELHISQKVRFRHFEQLGRLHSMHNEVLSERKKLLSSLHMMQEESDEH